MANIITCLDRQGNVHNVEHEKIVFRISAYGLLVENKSIVMVKSKWVDKWEFPGGGVKQNETLIEGLIREYEEETGLRVAVDSFLRFDEGYFYANDRNETWHTIRFCYFVHKVSGELRTTGNGDDIVEVANVPISDLTPVNINPVHYEAYKRFMAKL